MLRYAKGKRKKSKKEKQEKGVCVLMVMAGFSCIHPPLHMRVLKYIYIKKKE